MVEFVDASILDLVRATEFLYYIKPSLKGKFVFGIERRNLLTVALYFT